jgi:primosomal protein N' (replication factor Y) (superfamily II helicase)
MSNEQSILFANENELAEQRPRSGVVARVAMERGIDKLLDYAVPKTLADQIRVGQRVRVPLGRGDKLAPGYVAELSDKSELAKLKSIRSITDERTLLTPALMRLALWISRYYFTPFGLVLENLIPSAVKHRVGVKSVRVVRRKWTAEAIQDLIEKTKAKKRKIILARLLQLGGDEPIELNRLAMECDSKPPAILPLVKAGVVAIERVDSYAFQSHAGQLPSLHGTVTPPTLNEDQSKAIGSIVAALDGGFSVHLLFGVTGSGKTEVYLRAIDAVVKAGKTAIVLVPEIALTPQTVRRFTERFERVAVLHSGLTPTDRHRQWQAITDGRAQVVVGARSAVFANLENLGLIVVDEEHESSYKQDQAPRYHARDVAIKRAQVEKIPVLLGSATPSLEVWNRVQSAAGGYALHMLPNRVSNRPLPEVEIIDMKDANRGRRGMHLFSPRLEQRLKQTIERGQQAILLLNRRGYSNFIYCSSCQQAITCKYCDKTMTYHRGVDLKPTNRTSAGQVHAGQMQCHYCLAVQTLPNACPTCGKKLSLFGLGTQRVEEELIEKFPGLRYARVDSDTMRGGRSYEDLLAKFGSGELQVLMGTQMLAKGLDFPNVTLVGVINGDTALSLPDFRSAERTFQLLTQVAGRAGRGEQPGRVVVQSFIPEDQTIRLAVTQDYERFATSELQTRKAVGLPPFARQARIVVRDEDPIVATERAEKIAGQLRDAIEKTGQPAEIKNDGPMPAPVGKIAGYIRIQIILQSPIAGAIQRVLSRLRGDKGLISNDRVAIDVDPISLL